MWAALRLVETQFGEGRPRAAVTKIRRIGLPVALIL